MTAGDLLASSRKRMVNLSVCLAIIGLTALLGLAAMTTVDGLSRWLLHRPIDGVRDIASLLIAIAVSCCMPIALIENAHISVHLFESKRSSVLSKISNAFVAIAVAIVSGCLAWQFWVYAGRIAAANEMTMALRIPTAPFWYCVDFALWCAFAVQVVVAISEFVKIFDKTAKPIAQSGDGKREIQGMHP